MKRDTQGKRTFCLVIFDRCGKNWQRVSTSLRHVRQQRACVVALCDARLPTRSCRLLRAPSLSRALPSLPSSCRVKGDKKKATAATEVVTREYTVHLRKLLHGIGYKKRAPRAVKEIKAFAKKMMGTEVCSAPTHAPACLPPSCRCAAHPQLQRTNQRPARSCCRATLLERGPRGGSSVCSLLACHGSAAPSTQLPSRHLLERGLSRHAGCLPVRDPDPVLGSMQLPSRHPARKGPKGWRDGVLSAGLPEATASIYL